MKKIKTVWEFIAYACDFDLQVNKAISDGWSLVKRQVLIVGSKCLLYAELEREEENNA